MEKMYNFFILIRVYQVEGRILFIFKNIQYARSTTINYMHMYVVFN